jgi:hypothetical protein
MPREKLIGKCQLRQTRDQACLRLRFVSKGLAKKNEPILISFERLALPGFEKLEGLGQENRNKVWRHFQF